MKILLIQTAFIGDVILATAAVEQLAVLYPSAELHFLCRNGNESLLNNNPHITRVWIWDKKQSKLKHLFQLGSLIAKEKFDTVINFHRFASSGFLTAMSKAPVRIGFSKNPLSFLYTKRVKHEIGKGLHEVQRNAELIAAFAEKEIPNAGLNRPAIYPSPDDIAMVEGFKSEPFICIAPTSVWYTKQFHYTQWLSLIKELGSYKVYLLGAPADSGFCDTLIAESKHNKTVNLCGKLSLLQSAALMKDAVMNYVNDSAPLHLASAMNAPTAAVFCSTVQSFGFGPLADKAKVIEIEEQLYCRPCGLHGKKSCPEGHFRCALDIKTSQLLDVL